LAKADDNSNKNKNKIELKFSMLGVEKVENILLFQGENSIFSKTRICDFLARDFRNIFVASSLKN